MSVASDSSSKPSTQESSISIADFRVCLDIASLPKRMVELERHIMFPTV